MSTLEEENSVLRNENAILRAQVLRLEEALANATTSSNGGNDGSNHKKSVSTTHHHDPNRSGTVSTATGPSPRRFGVNNLTKDQVERYSRQSLLDDFRPDGTAKLLNSTVLIIGAGGLGSTVALYLAAAGVGKLKIVDFDLVERSNLHRQVIHNDYRIDMPKAISAKLSCLALNPTIEVEAVLERFGPTNAEGLLDGVDVVVDASDNVAARYVINDVCALHEKVLVSGSAMRWEGQLTVYGYTDPHTNDPAVPPPKGPCYRCLFPKPPPQSAVGSCSDTGVVGVAPGAIGVLQALEVQKVLMGTAGVMSGRMLLFDGLRGSYKTIKLRPRQASCTSCCAPSARRFQTILEAYKSGEFPEYEVVSCNVPKALPPKMQCSVQDLQRALREKDELDEQRDCAGDENPQNAENTNNMSANAPMMILDVRDKVQYEMCSLPNSINYPLKELRKDLVAQGQMEGGQNSFVVVVEHLLLERMAAGKLEKKKAASTTTTTTSGAVEADVEKEEEPTLQRSGSVVDTLKRARPVLPKDIYVLCRRGVASSQAVELLTERLTETTMASSCGDLLETSFTLRNVQGGLTSWCKKVDTEFPEY